MDQYQVLLLPILPLIDGIAVYASKSLRLPESSTTVKQGNNVTITDLTEVSDHVFDWVKWSLWIIEYGPSDVIFAYTMTAVVDHDERSEAALLVLLYLKPHAIYRLLNHSVIKVLFPCDISVAKPVLLDVRRKVFQVILDFRKVFKLSIISVTFAQQPIVMIAKKKAYSLIGTEEVWRPSVIA